MLSGKLEFRLFALPAQYVAFCFSLGDDTSGNCAGWPFSSNVQGLKSSGHREYKKSNETHFLVEFFCFTRHIAINYLKTTPADACKTKADVQPFQNVLGGVPIWRQIRFWFGVVKKPGWVRTYFPDNAKMGGNHMWPGDQSEDNSSSESWSISALQHHVGQNIVCGDR